jgi:hypothetical protein
MQIVPLGQGFAVELRGITLQEIAADDAAYAAARAAFEEHSVLVFRDQQVSDEVQLAFSRRFGPPEVTKVGSVGTGTNFVTISTIGEDGKVVPPDHRLALRNKANQLWMAGHPVAASLSSNPHLASAAVVLGHMKCVDSVSLGNCARSTPSTLYPPRASSIASGAPAQRVPTTMTSCRVNFF